MLRITKLALMVLQYQLPTIISIFAFRTPTTQLKSFSFTEIICSDMIDY